MRTFNFASPFSVALILVGVALAALVLTGALGFRFDPLDLTAKRADRAVASAQHATSDAAARRIEVAGAADTAARVETARQTADAAQTVIHRYVYSAQAAPDALSPLDPDRLARLRHLDDGLCALHAPGCYTAPPPDPGGSAAPLQPGSPAD